VKLFLVWFIASFCAVSVFLSVFDGSLLEFVVGMLAGGFVGYVIAYVGAEWVTRD
jgi:hypothetical protein